MQNKFEEFRTFLGIKDDESQKDLPLQYFFKATNYNFQEVGLSGMEKILMPERIIQLDTSEIDGIFEYKFLDNNNQLQTEQIGICNGTIYKDILTTPIVLRTGLSLGKVSFVFFNNNLYIANGKDNIYIYDGNLGVVSQMGAPLASIDGLGILNGDYYWALSYVTAGGEEVVGSISNTLTLVNNKVLLTLPLGYDGTLSRKIYRTEANGSTLKLLVTIGDNTTLTFEDNFDDSSLTTEIINTNNPLPKPYFISVFNERLIGARVDLFPTQIFITDNEVDVFDLASGLDISNFSDDNTPVTGLGIDFSNIVVGTEKHIYLINTDPSISVITTRTNIGIKDGYSVVRIPAYGNFSGGLMFVSTNNDVRVLVGLQALPVATSVDNIYSNNFSQNIRGSLVNDLNSPNNIYALYYNYRYHLIIDTNKYVYDIRTNGWTFHNIQTENYKSNPYVLGILLNNLFNGQNNGWVEQEYLNIDYRGEDVPAILESPTIYGTNNYKFIQKLIFWFTPSEDNEITIEVTKNDDVNFLESSTFSIETGAYSDTDYSSAEYEISGEMDYRVFNIYEELRWLSFKVINTKGNILFQGWGIFSQLLAGKE